jgi:hypothetical protein
VIDSLFPLLAEIPLLLQSEKIYAVLAVLLVIWGGILFLLIRLDLRIACLEKQIPEVDPNVPHGTDGQA